MHRITYRLLSGIYAIVAQGGGAFGVLSITKLINSPIINQINAL